MEYQTQLPLAWQERWQAQNFTTASAIQAKSYPLLKAGQDLLGISPTGTGKTLAYLMPLLEKVVANGEIQLLVLLPSQELAVQVAEVAKTYSADLKLKVQLLIGGANKKRQLEKLKQKPEVVIGTAGRIRELLVEKKVKLHSLKMLVLDEVDQLLEAQSEGQILLDLLRRLPKELQKVAFSATGASAEPFLIEQLNWQLPKLDVTHEDQSKGVIQHYYIVVDGRKRVDLLRRFSHIPDFSGLVFFNQLQDLGAAAEKLIFEGILVASLASDQSKLERELAIKAFRNQRVRLLLTTELAARGLDFQNLDYILHYDVPFSKESYLHRSGRVGRMGKVGTVITFIAPHQLKDLKKVAGEKLTECFVYGGQIQLEAPKSKTRVAQKAQPKRAAQTTDSRKPREEQGAQNFEVATNPPSSSPQKTTGLGQGQPFNSETTPSVRQKARKKPKTKKQKNKGARKKR